MLMLLCYGPRALYNANVFLQALKDNFEENRTNLSAIVVPMNRILYFGIDTLLLFGKILEGTVSKTFLLLA